LCRRCPCGWCSLIPPITPLSSNIDLDVTRMPHTRTMNLPSAAATPTIPTIPTIPATTTPHPNPKHVQSIPFIPKRDHAIKKVVSEFANKLRRTFDIFLRDNVQLPLWQPPLDLADETRRHITDLKIPIISPSSQSSLLLLHNLGQPSHDAQLARRVDGLFKQGHR